jgi:hypothetical protein
VFLELNNISKYKVLLGGLKDCKRIRGVKIPGIWGKSKIVNSKIPNNTQWQIFPREFTQLRLSELIEYSVGLPAATSKGNSPSQSTRLSATLPHCAHELVSSQPTSCFANELPFSVANAGRPTAFSIGGTPCKNFPFSVVRIYSYKQMRPLLLDFCGPLGTLRH